MAFPARRFFSVDKILRLLLFVVMVILFLIAIKLFGVSVKAFGKDAASSLFEGLQNPFAGLAVGILSTVLVQSSSVTTSTVVAMVGAGALPLQYAVPVVMGANVGTSITNTLVSLGHVRQSDEFQRAFAGATVHDFFNLLCVLLFFPLELATGLLRHSAEWIVSRFPAQSVGGNWKSPISGTVKYCAGLIESFFHDVLGMSGKPLACVLLVVALVMVVVSLILITRNMRILMADRIEVLLNRILQRSGLLGLVIGMVVTMLVQSSSITTSLLVPMFGAGVLTLEAGFPIMLGANIGTTITAMLAAAVTGPTGLTIAVVHLLFNVAGTGVFFPFKTMRRVPIICSEKLAELATTNRIFVLVYIGGVFVIMPLLGILIWK